MLKRWVNFFMLGIIVSAVLTSYCVLLLVNTLYHIVSSSLIQNILQCLNWIMHIPRSRSFGQIIGYKGFFSSFQLIALFHVAIGEKLDLHWFHMVLYIFNHSYTYTPYSLHWCWLKYEKKSLKFFPQIFLSLGVLFIASGLTGISLKWKQEWPTVPLSLQVQICPDANKVSVAC